MTTLTSYAQADTAGTAGSGVAKVQKIEFKLAATAVAGASATYHEKTVVLDVPTAAYDVTVSYDCVGDKDTGANVEVDCTNGPENNNAFPTAAEMATLTRNAIVAHKAEWASHIRVVGGTLYIRNPDAGADTAFLTTTAATATAEAGNVLAGAATGSEKFSKAATITIKLDEPKRINTIRIIDFVDTTDADKSGCADAGCYPRMDRVAARTLLEIGAAKTIYTTAPPTGNVANGLFDDAETAVCSNRGICDQSEGICQCFEGHTGVACETQTILV